MLNWFSRNCVRCFGQLVVIFRCIVMLNWWFCNLVFSVWCRFLIFFLLIYRLLLWVMWNCEQVVMLCFGNRFVMCVWIIEESRQNEDCFLVDRWFGSLIMCGSMCGVLMMMMVVLCLKVFLLESLMMKLRFLLCICGKGWVGFSLMGVSSGCMCCLKYCFIQVCWVLLWLLWCSRWMLLVVSCGRIFLFRSLYWCVMMWWYLVLVCLSVVCSLGGLMFLFLMWLVSRLVMCILKNLLRLLL